MTSAVQVLVTGLAALHPGKVATEAPADMDSRLPFYRVQRTSGSDDTWPYDHAVLDIDTFAPDELTAYNAAEVVRQWVRLTLPGSTVAGVYINRTQTVMAPRWVPWDNTTMRRVTASYRITLH